MEGLTIYTCLTVRFCRCCQMSGIEQCEVQILANSHFNKLSLKSYILSYIYFENSIKSVEAFISKMHT